MINQFASSLLLIEIIQVIIMILATLVLIFALRKSRELYLLMCCYVSLSIGLFFSIIEIFHSLYTLLSLLFYLASTLFLFATVFLKYYQLSLIHINQRKKYYLFLIFAGVISLIIFGIEFVILGFLCFGVIISLVNYSKKAKPTYGLYTITMIIGFISILSIILEDAGYPWAYELRQGMAIVLGSMFLATAIVAILEHRMEKSNIQYRNVYNRAELYKDLFLHDVNNILQSVLSATEICSLKVPKIIPEDKQNDMINLFETIEDQVNRGSDLISNIVLLSELDLKEIPLQKLDVREQITSAIKKVNDFFSNKDFKITYDFQEKELSVKANKLLVELFYNLLNNSIRHNKSTQAKIEINVSSIAKNNQKYVQVEIIDNGIGINKQIKREINKVNFTKIYTKKRLGLGLIFVCKVLYSYGGHLIIQNRIKDNYKKGSKFIIYLIKA